METTNQIKLDFQIRFGTKYDIARIMELQTENSILHLGPENLYLNGGLENIFTLSDLKKLTNSGCISVATTNLKGDPVEPEKNLIIIGYVIIQPKRIANDVQTLNFFRDRVNTLLLSQVVVDKNFRKNSVGTLLIENIIKKNEKSGKNFIAFAAKNNIPVTRLLKKNNFNYSERGVGRTYWNDNIINIKFER